MVVMAHVIRLKRSGRMARFADDGRLAEWTADPNAASYFSDIGAARAAIRGICAPEIRSALRSGRAVFVLDDDTGEELIVDAGHARLWRTPRIRIDGRARYIQDDPLDDGRSAIVRRKALKVRTFVRGEFAMSRKNPRRQTEALITPSATAEEYRMSVSRRTRLMSYVPRAR